MSFALAGWMLYAMWGVLGVMGIDFLASVFRSLKRSSFSTALVLDYLRDLLNYVFPLFIVVNLIPLDPTGWILLIGYYLASLAVFLRYVFAIKDKF